MTTRLLVFGDSFVAGVGDAECRGWVGRATAAACARGASVIPFALGVPGQTTPEIAARWRAEAEARRHPEAPLRLVFSFGANDSATAEDGGPRVPPARTLSAAEALLAAARAWAPTVVVGPLPILDDAAADARLAVLCPALGGLCARLGVPYLPVFDTLRHTVAWTAGAAGNDGTHPDAAGYAALAAVVDGWAPWRALLVTGGESASPPPHRCG
jgi:lysophospholipase L1-like esterase